MESNCIAENLRFLRQNKGYSLEDVAEIINVSRQTVGKWESSDSLPDIMNCVKLATLYKLSLDELVNRPLGAMSSSDFNEKEGKVCGIVSLDENSKIRIPSQILSMFDISIGDNLILLADVNQGIALVKCRNFLGEE